MALQVSEERIASTYPVLCTACNAQVGEMFDEAASILKPLAEQDAAAANLCDACKKAQDTYNETVRPTLMGLIQNFETVVEISTKFKNMDYSGQVHKADVDITQQKIETTNFNL